MCLPKKRDNVSEIMEDAGIIIPDWLFDEDELEENISDIEFELSLHDPEPWLAYMNHESDDNASPL